jgi:hypothetical protein
MLYRYLIYGCHIYSVFIVKFKIVTEEGGPLNKFSVSYNLKHLLERRYVKT